MNNSLLLNRLWQTNHPKSRKLGILFAASPLKIRSYSCNNADPRHTSAEFPIDPCQRGSSSGNTKHRVTRSADFFSVPYHTQAATGNPHRSTFDQNWSHRSGV